MHVAVDNEDIIVYAPWNAAAQSLSIKLTLGGTARPITFEHDMWSEDLSVTVVST
jgi:hypothetical protein